MLKISGLIITYNEAHNIVDCIRSLRRVCSDVVVVDSNSSDDTVALAEREGAVVIRHAFLGDGPQRSLGLPHCRNEWVINLDADERLEDDLVEWLSITELSQLQVDAVEVRRRNYIGDRTTRFAGQYPDYVCRIFDKRSADFSPVAVHSRIQAKRLTQAAVHIRHYSYKDYADMFNRTFRYAATQAREIAAGGKRLKAWQPAVHALVSFLKHYVVKLGFLAGVDGLALSLSKSVATFMKYGHALELRRAGKARK